MSIETISTPLPPTDLARNLQTSYKQDHAAGAHAATDPVAQAPNKQQAQAAAENSAEGIKSAVETVQSFIKQQSGTDLSFSVDQESGARIVKVIDRSTDEVIRQIPSDEMLQIARALDKLQGILLKQKA